MQNRRVPAALITACVTAVAANAAIIYVDANASGANTGATWADAYTDLATALQFAQADDQVWVAQGEYLPGQFDKPLSIPSKVAVYGGFQGGETSLDQRDSNLYHTTITGDYNRDDLPGFVNRADNAGTLVTFESTAASTRLDGFTLTGGHALDFFTGRGGAIEVFQGAGVVENCRFVENFAEYDGGAVWMSESGDFSFAGCIFRDNAAGQDQSGVFGGAVGALITGELRFEDCRFMGNAAVGTSAAAGGAVSLSDAQKATFVRCDFQDNTCAASIFSDGAGLALSSTPADLIDCLFLNNDASSGSAGSGGALAHSVGIGDEADLNIVACRLLGNTAVYGGAVDASTGNGDGAGTVRIVGSVVAANTAERGGGVYTDATTFVELSTIAHNSSTSSLSQVGGGVRNSGANPLTIRNSILWANVSGSETGEDAQVYDSIGPAIGFTCVQGWTGAHGGPGNIGLDPVFWDADGNDNLPGTEDDNYDLGPFSPCIDAASNTVVPADALDLDGDGDTAEKLPLDLHLDPRRVDDPSVDDTGQGVAPIVDMGAAEAQEGSCIADFNDDGSVNTLDVLAFLNAWAAGDSQADINRDGVVNTLDVLGFLNLWISGC